MSISSIERTLNLPGEKVQVFTLFFQHFSSWWPKEYTWSKDALSDIYIEPKIGGWAIEKGKNGFSCTFARVLEFIEPQKLVLAWHIGPNSAPEPDEKKASKLLFCFEGNVKKQCELVFEHQEIEKHGEGSENYFEALNSPHGWDFVLNNFEQFVVKSI